MAHVAVGRLELPVRHIVGGAGCVVMPAIASATRQIITFFMWLSFKIITVSCSDFQSQRRHQTRDGDCSLPLLNPVTTAREELPNKQASAWLKDEDTTINKDKSFTANHGT